MKYIFLHGMGQTASSWDKTISCLPHTIEPICLELSSFFTKDNCNYNTIYTAFCTYCNNFSEPFHLCGLSLGAVLALNYAIDFPQKVASLTLIAPQYDIPKFLFKAQKMIFKFMPQSQFENIGFTKNDFIALTNSMVDIDFTNDLTKVICPTLILCGEKDKVNKKTALKLNEKLSRSKFSTINHSKHEVNIDNPHDLAKAIEKYIFTLHT